MAEQTSVYVVPLQQLLKTMVEYGGTDLHITVDSAPQVRINGRMVPLKLPPWTPRRPAGSATGS